MNPTSYSSNQNQPDCLLFVLNLSVFFISIHALRRFCDERSTTLWFVIHGASIVIPSYWVLRRSNTAAALLLIFVVVWRHNTRPQLLDKHYVWINKESRRHKSDQIDKHDGSQSIQGVHDQGNNHARLIALDSASQSSNARNF